MSNFLEDAKRIDVPIPQGSRARSRVINGSSKTDLAL